MDVVYVFRHSQFDDLEIQYSLRSVAKYLPWIRKVWIFGDRPNFLSEQTDKIEHVSWEAVAWVGRFQTPVKNFPHFERPYVYQDIAADVCVGLCCDQVGERPRQ